MKRITIRFNRILTFTQQIIDKFINLIIQDFQEIKQFTLNKFIASQRYFRNFWIQWNKELSNKLIVYLVGILLVLLLSSIVLGIVELYQSTSSSYILTAGIQLLQKVSIRSLAFALVVFISLWLTLGFLSRQVLIGLFFSRNWCTNSLTYIIKLLGSLPTLILGNATLDLINLIGFRPHNSIASAIFVIGILTLVGLPTVLQIGQEVLRDYDRKKLQPAISLGVNKIVIGKKIFIPHVCRSLNAAVTIGVSRIIIEGYIVLNQIFSGSFNNITIIQNQQDFLDIFYSIYSTMTVESNVVLILLLFVVALIVNLSFNIAPMQRS